MSETGNFHQLCKVVIDHSEASTFLEAKEEWALVDIFRTDESSCICGHFIQENCQIRNLCNGEELIVGNVCIKHFENEMAEEARKAFKAYKRILKDPSINHPNNALIKLAAKAQWINDFEEKFYGDTWRKQNKTLSYKQKRICLQINLKILIRVDPNYGPMCPRLLQSSQSSTLHIRSVNKVMKVTQNQGRLYYCCSCGQFISFIDME